MTRMSDNDDNPDVDDLLEAAYGQGKEKKSLTVDRDARSTSASHRSKEPPGTSPEPQNGSDKRSDTSERRRRRSRSTSLSKSRSRSPKLKKKKSTRSRSRDRKRHRSTSRSRSRRESRDKKRSPKRSPSVDSDVERERRRRKNRSRSKSRSPSRSRSRDRRRNNDRDRNRRRDKTPSRSRSRERRRSRSRGRYDRRDDDRDRFGGNRRNNSPPFRGRGGGGGGRRSPPNRGYGGFGGGGGYGGFGGGGRGGGRARQSIERARSVRSESPALPAEERDQRTVFCMQLAQTINAKDLEKFFSSVGKVRDVRLIVDSKTRRSKGIAYVEFRELEAVPLALGLHGQKLKNCPMNIQPTHAEKNRAAMAAAGAVQKGPMRLYVGSLHFNITEDMLKDIFEPFGKIDSIQLMMDVESGRSRGYAFITFRDAQDAKRAMEQLNGFELAGRAMKIGHVTDRNDSTGQSLDNDDLDRPGFDLGPTGRLQLMAKLAEGTGMKIPQQPVAPAPTPGAMAPIATQCFMLSNMFDPKAETEPGWERELQQEIVDECTQHGGVVHVDVDKTSEQGHVYVKCTSISAAVSAVQHLHGRYFAGKMITANYIPTMNYHQLFPDAMRAVAALQTSSQ